MRVTLTYADFKARAVAGVSVYHYIGTGTFIGRLNNLGVTCEYLDTAMPGTWAVDFPLSTSVSNFAEA